MKMLKDNLGDDFDEWSRVADKAIDGEQEQELIGMSSTFTDPFNSNLTLVKLVNMLYELNVTQGCTGLLWATEDGTVIQGRGFDDLSHHFSSLPSKDAEASSTSHLKEVANDVQPIFEVVFKRAGKPLYIATTSPGMVGFHTAMRFGGWSFAQNTRLSKVLDPQTKKLNLAAARKGGRPHGLAVRRVMDNTPDFESAMQKLYSAKYMAPLYMILGGTKPYEGAVLTLDRLGEHEQGTPPIFRLNESDWHIVQTNDDIGQPALDMRRPIADGLFMVMDRKQTSVGSTFKFLRSPPFFWTPTVFTSVMVPTSGYYHTVLSTDSEPVVSSVLGSSTMLLETGAEVKPHAYSTFQQSLRGARPDLSAEISSFLQLSTDLAASRKTEL
jgi:hypothetical protein